MENLYMIGRLKDYYEVNGEKMFVWSIFVNDKKQTFAKVQKEPGSGGLILVETFEPCDLITNHLI